MKIFFNTLGAMYIGGLFLTCILMAATWAGDGLSVVPKWLIYTSLVCVGITLLIGDRNEPFLLQASFTPILGFLGAMAIGLHADIMPETGDNLQVAEMFDFMRETAALIVNILFYPPLLGLIYALTEGRRKPPPGRTDE